MYKIRIRRDVTCARIASASQNLWLLLVSVGACACTIHKASTGEPGGVQLVMDCGGGQLVDGGVVVKRGPKSSQPTTDLCPSAFTVVSPSFGFPCSVLFFFLPHILVVVTEEHWNRGEMEGVVRPAGSTEEGGPRGFSCEL